MTTGIDRAAGMRYASCVTIAALLAAIALHMPTPAVQVVVGECPGASEAVACALPHAGTIYVQPAFFLYPRTEAQIILAHEVAHVWDAATLTDTDRAHYLAGVGASATWDTGGDELFADTAAFCGLSAKQRATVRSHHGYRGTYGERITAQHVAQTCWYMRAKGAGQ